MITQSSSTKNSTESIPSLMFSILLMSDGKTRRPNLSICLTQPIALIGTAPFLKKINDFFSVSISYYFYPILSIDKNKKFL